MKKILGLCALLAGGSAIAQNNLPTVTNLMATVDTAQKQVTVTFNLGDPENDSLEVSFAVSNNIGQTYFVNSSAVTGNVGFPVMPGTGKQLVWDYSAITGAGQDYRLKVVANDRKGISIQAMVDQVDSVRLKNDMDIVEGTRHYTAGAVHLAAVKDTIDSRFGHFGLENYRQQFSYFGYNAENIIGKKAGQVAEGTVYILDGHYDCVDDGPGADDNASAVIGVLEAARILSQYEFKKTIHFIGFDLEELGLLGSKEYVNNGIKPGETVSGVLNYEMIGYYSDRKNSQVFPPGFNILFPAAQAAVAADTFRGNFITNVANVASSSLKQKFDAAAATYVPDLRVISLEAPGTSTLVPDLRRSDHAPFWDANIQALMLTDGAEFRNHNYHTALDVSDSLDFGFIQKVVKATVGTLAELAEPIHAGNGTVDVQILNVTAGIKENDMADRLSISPNPGNDQVNIQWSNINTYHQVSLTDMKGNVVYKSNLAPNGNQHTIITETFANGVYIVNISGKGAEMTQRIVVKH